MNTYIQKDIEGFYYETEEEITGCGFSYQDFLDGKYIHLSEDQVHYHADFPESDIEMVMNVASYKDGKITYYCEDTPISLESVKLKKLEQLAEYDKSDTVNDFTVNETTHMWFSPEERSNFKSSIESAKILGVETLQMFLDETLFTIPTAQAEIMLAQIQMYADQCYIVTKRHQINVKKLNTIRKVERYDFTTGYPQKLNFDISV